MNNKKIILTAVVIAAGLGLLFWLGQINVRRSGRPFKQPAVLNSSLVSDKMLYDFGTISMADGVVRQDFRIKNISSAPIMIEKMYTSCMCTIAEFMMGDRRMGPFGMPGHGVPVPFLRQTIGPGEEAIIAVNFDPAAHGPAGVGRIERLVYLENGGQPLLTLAIRANVTP